jgi:hypothetical protein
MFGLSRIRSVALLVVFLFPAGCGRTQPQLVYQDDQGFRITPPPGWSERERPAASASPARHRKQTDLPLPPLGVIGTTSQEQVLVRYDRLTAGRQAWLRVTAADLPASVALKPILSGRAPRSNWRLESEVESLDVGGHPGLRIAFAGRWSDQDYLCEIVAVHKGERVWFITSSFPAADETAREQVRHSVAGVSWR